MNKDTRIFIGLIILIAIAAILIWYRPPQVQNPNQQQNQVYVPPAPSADKLPPFLSVKVSQISGQNLYFKYLDQSKFVTISASTKLVKQVNENGVFKEVAIKLSDIKAGQFVEITFGNNSNSASSIKLLQ